MKINKFVLFLVSIFLTAISASVFGKIYDKLYPLPSGFAGFIVGSFWSSFLRGVDSAYIFFLTFLFTAYGGNKRYLYLMILLIPAILFQFYFGDVPIYYPIAVFALGLVSGFLLSKNRKKGRNFH